MAFQKPKLTLSEVSQTFDLEELTGIDLSDRPDLLTSFGQEVIDIILNRTEEGKDISGKNLKGYKEDYIDSEVFEAFGKSPREINMILRGQMLRDLDILEINGSKVTVGFSEDLQIKKAFNHNTGDTKGMPKRRFFGVLKKDIEQELKEIKAAATEQETQESEIIRDAITALRDRSTANEVTESLFGNVFGGLFGTNQNNQT